LRAGLINKTDFSLNLTFAFAAVQMHERLTTDSP